MKLKTRAIGLIAINSSDNKAICSKSKYISINGKGNEIFPDFSSNRKK